MTRPRTLIIAEAGVNHNGSMEAARRLVDAAAEAGVDYVKFQTFKAEKISSRFAAKASYQVENTGSGGSQLDMLRKLELSEAEHYELQAYCAQKGIAFLSTAFDLDSIDLLLDMGITLGKIPSGEITNLPYLRKMARSFPDLIVSTGMTLMEELEAALKALIDAGAVKERITVLHCNTEYPTPMQDVHLRAMNHIRDSFGIAIGYSDHTLGIEVPIAAVALGATVIEKHFTLDKTMEGPDHKASLEPAELKAMASAIRNIEQALGTADKKPSPSELKNIAVARKSIVAARPIRKGEFFSDDNLAVKRPGDGISPMRWDEVIGQASPADFEPDQPIVL